MAAFYLPGGRDCNRPGNHQRSQFRLEVIKPAREASISSVSRMLPMAYWFYPGKYETAWPTLASISCNTSGHSTTNPSLSKKIFFRPWNKN
jgi:hypothetical protein